MSTMVCIDEDAGGSDAPWDGCREGFPSCSCEAEM